MPADRTPTPDWPPRFTIAAHTPKEAAHLIRGLIEKSETGDIKALEPAFESIINIAIRTAEDAVRERTLEEAVQAVRHRWTTAPNVRTDKAVTSFEQNAIGPGCAAAIAVIRALANPGSGEG